jgi:hypothetical protein
MYRGKSLEKIRRASFCITSTAYANISKRETVKCNKCGKEMSFENTTGRGFDIGLCEECEWDKPADLPEAGASAERITSVVRRTAIIREVL